MADVGKSAVQAQPADVRDVLPRSASIIEAFHSESGCGGDGQFILDMAYALASHHQRQWDAEDVSRVSGASAQDVAASKRLIDELNARRVALVEEIDQWVAARIRSRADASLHTETVGSVVDRLAIGWVRANRMISTGDARDRVRLAVRQLAELADAYDDLVRDVASGQRRLPAWLPLKRYRNQS